MDMKWPGRYGQARLTAGTKLIALSAYGTEESRRSALKAGFDEYLTKPADLEVLQSLLGVGKACGGAAPLNSSD